jgi:GT2 family glycosyltransferase
MEAIMGDFESKRADPRVCVVVLNWNAKDILRECVESLTRSEYSLSMIIVVDNGSIDGSQQMIKTYFPEVVLVENGENLGVPDGKNRGIIRALEEDIDFIYTLDNDLIVQPQTIKELVSFLEGNPDVGCVGSIIYYYDRPDFIFSAGHYVDWSQNLVRTRGANRRDIGQFTEVSTVDYVGAGAMLTRKSVFDSVGLLDAGFIGYGYDDADFGLRVNKAGYKVVCYSRSKVWHRPFSGIGRYSFKKKYLEARNAIRFLRMYGNRRNWAKFFFYAIAGLAYASVREGLRGNIKGVIGKARGLYDGLRGREDLAYNLLKQ